MREAANGKAAQKAVGEWREAVELSSLPSRTEMAGGEDFAAGFAALRIESVAVSKSAARVGCDAPLHGCLGWSLGALRSMSGTQRSSLKAS
jgi:hypothetical protein